MSPRIIERNNALEAWQAGVTEILELGGNANNLISVINNPCEINTDWLANYSPHHISSRGNNIKDVANTLFPDKLIRTYTSREDLYERYLALHDRAHRRPQSRHTWGTYFERLIRFPPTNVNQLERVITKLNTWPTHNTTGLVFHLSSPVIDAPRTRGGPCWHYGELLWSQEGILDLVAVYRNHDFFNKVLGNYIGLGRLLRFICDSSGKTPGKLICHSVHAYHDSSKRDLIALANNEAR